MRKWNREQTESPFKTVRVIDDPIYIRAVLQLRENGGVKRGLGVGVGERAAQFGFMCLKIL